ncbi:MAG: Mlc titration factor MtfA (ptsG expression regulator) [Dokdonia sp.]|jgi:Mlc titration factor MtfA (ptsG expression regulator)
MLITQQYISEYEWLIPYIFGVLGLWVLYILFRFFENWYANTFDRLLYRDIFVFRKLSRKQKETLTKEFSFYTLLTTKEKRRFEHRVASFIKDKEFIGRENLEVTDPMKVLIAAVGCMLTFGRKNYKYALVDHILIYPKVFYSSTNDDYHKGEFNPRQKALVLSWEDFEIGYRITDDNLNLGIHEFMHALQLDAKQRNDIDGLRFERQFQKILRRLTDQDLKDKLDEVAYFRAYAFTNQFEFMAVLAEYFIESPKDFKRHFPQLYAYQKCLLNFDFADY